MSTAAVMAFACTHIPIAALVLAVSVHLPQYFATHLGMSLVLVGGAFALVRAIDIPLDPALGLAMDKTRTRFGRFRLWILIGAPILMLALYVLINAPADAGRGWLIGWLLVMYVGYSILLLSHVAWAATLATNYQQRSRIFGGLTVLGTAGAMAVLIIPVAMQARGATDAQGVEAMVWFIIISAPLMAAITVWRTPETLAPEHHTGFTLKDYRALLTRPNVVRLLVADLCVTLGPGWMAAVYLFYFKDSRGFDTTQANLLLLIYIAAGFAGAPFTAWLAGKISKHRALMVTTTIYSLTLITLSILPRGEFLAAVPTMFLAGAMAAGFTVMIRAITGDIGDEIRLESGRELMGLMYALTTATTKLAGAASIFLTFNVLAAVGYQAAAGATNSPEAIRGLELAYLIGPIVFVMLGGAFFFGYRLTEARHAEIRSELEARDALYDQSPVLQGLTGEPGHPAPEKT